MTLVLKSWLREARYHWPAKLAYIAPEQSPDWVVERCARMVSTIGYFAGGADTAPEVAEKFCAVAHAAQAQGIDTVLALKAPQLDFDAALVRRIAGQGVPVILDAMPHTQASHIHTLAEQSGAGLALPARWARSVADAVRLRDTPCRIRLVKGKWADPNGDPADIAAAYLHLAGILAGRKAVVGVATHDPALARAALTILQNADTPVELEQIRGLPRRRAMAVARNLCVPVRLYQPFGPGWWPYAADQALRRPHLPLWAIQDLIGR